MMTIAQRERLVWLRLRREVLVDKADEASQQPDEVVEWVARDRLDNFDADCGEELAELSALEDVQT